MTTPVNDSAAITNEQQASDYCALLTDAAGMERLGRLESMLREENERQNLVSNASLAALWERHFADSAQLLEHVPRETGLWMDLGSGAGFPGLVIAAMRPDQDMLLVESRKKRIEWLERAISALGLDRCKVAGARLEDVPTRAAGVISARAFAPLDRLLRLSARFSTPDSVWLLPKGRSAAKELAEQPKRVAAMFHVEPSRTDPQAGILLGRGAPEIS